MLNCTRNAVEIQFYSFEVSLNVGLCVNKFFFDVLYSYMIRIKRDTRPLYKRKITQVGTVFAKFLRDSQKGKFLVIQAFLGPKSANRAEALNSWSRKLQDADFEPIFMEIGSKSIENEWFKVKGRKLPVISAHTVLSSTLQRGTSIHVITIVSALNLSPYLHWVYV